MAPRESNAIAAENKLSAVMSILLHPALTPAVRQKAERLRGRLAEMLTQAQVESARAEASSEKIDQWLQKTFAVEPYPSGYR